MSTKNAGAFMVCALLAGCEDCVEGVNPEENQGGVLVIKQKNPPEKESDRTPVWPTGPKE